MKKIEPFDLERMLFGEAPPEFLIEVFFRGLFLYLFMIIIVRKLGKRMAGGLTITEMVLMVILGGSIAVSIQLPEGGALIGFVVLICALLYELGFGWLTTRSKSIENISQGKVILLVKDGVLQINTLRSIHLTLQQLFSELRSRNIYQLGQVERLYMEADGNFSIYEPAEQIPGLPIYPPDDFEMVKSLKKADGLKACRLCGYTAKPNADNCTKCNNNKWAEAII